MLIRHETRIDTRLPVFNQLFNNIHRSVDDFTCTNSFDNILIKSDNCFQTRVPVFRHHILTGNVVDKTNSAKSLARAR